MSEEIFQPMEESSWTGTKEAARWNDAYSRPLAELDMNSKQRDENDIEGAEKSESISTEQIQAGKLFGLIQRIRCIYSLIIICLPCRST